MKRIYNVEFLRVLFCLAIMSVHLSRSLHKFLPQSDLFATLAKMVNNAPKAVEGFFILSGLFLFLTFKPDCSVVDFVKKKIIRLLPVVFFTIFLGGVVSACHLMKFNFDAVFLPATLTNMIADFSRVAHMGLGPVWYVSVLFWVSLLYFYLMKYYRRENVNLTIGLLTVLGFFICLRINKGRLSAPEYSNGIWNVGFLRGFGAIGMGYFLGMWYKNRDDLPMTTKQFAANTILEVIFMFLVVYNMFVYCVNHIYDFNLVMYEFILIYLFCNNRGWLSQLFDKKYWGYISRYCYSIFVVHNLTWVATKYVVEYLPNDWAILAFVLGVPILLGIFMYHFIEIPVANYLNDKWFKHH